MKEISLVEWIFYTISRGFVCNHRMKKLTEAYNNVLEAFDVVFLYKLWTYFKTDVEKEIKLTKPSYIELRMKKESDNKPNNPSLRMINSFEEGGGRGSVFNVASEGMVQGVK